MSIRILCDRAVFLNEFVSILDDFCIIGWIGGFLLLIFLKQFIVFHIVLASAFFEKVSSMKVLNFSFFVILSWFLVCVSVFVKIFKFSYEGFFRRLFAAVLLSLTRSEHVSFHHGAFNGRLVGEVFFDFHLSVNN